MLNIAFGQSKYYVDNLSENIKRGHRQKLRKGIWPGFAPLGYLNNSRTKSIDLDKEKSVLVRKCFELYATGDNTLKNVKQFLADSKLDSYKGNVLSTSCVQRMLKILFTMELSASTASSTKEATSQLFPRNFLMTFNK